MQVRYILFKTESFVIKIHTNLANDQLLASDNNQEIMAEMHGIHLLVLN